MPVASQKSLLANRSDKKLSETDQIARLARPDTYAADRLGMKLHPKQAAVLRAWFQKRSRVSLRTGNEVGKTSTIGVAGILYAIEILHAQVISTAGSWMQVAQQLIPRLRGHAFRFPQWEFISTAIKVDGIERYLGFSTRDEGTAQGFHADPNRPLVVLLDEAAAVQLPIYNALEERCNPSHMLIMGSPLDPTGQFYAIETTLAAHYQHFHLPQTECLQSQGWWINDDDVKRKITKYGAEHPLILSNVFGEFAKAVAGALLSLRDWVNCLNNPPPLRDGDMHLFADVAGGGAKNVVAFRRGNRVRVVRKWRGSSEMETIGEIIGIMNALKKTDGLTPEQCSIDASGAGKPMADRFHELGYFINKFFGASAPRFDDECYNARAEVWCSGCAAVKACNIIVDDDEDLRMQLLQATRKRHSGGKFLMTSKEDMVKDGLDSPDEADAVLGAMMPAPQLRSTSLVQLTQQDSSCQTDWSGSNGESDGTRRYFT